MRAGCWDDVVSGLASGELREPWEPCPLPPEAAGPQSARAAPWAAGRASWRKPRSQHAAWRTEATQEVLEKLRDHCARCEVPAAVRSGLAQFAADRRHDVLACGVE